jgi:hypothetical protein
MLGVTHSETPKPPPPSMWPAVLLVVAVLASVVVMSALHIPTDDLLQLVPLLVLPLLAYLIGQVNQVKHQTNGNVTRLMEQLQSAQEALARSVPADSATQAPPEPPAQPQPYGRAPVEYTQGTYWPGGE